MGVAFFLGTRTSSKNLLLYFFKRFNMILKLFLFLGCSRGNGGFYGQLFKEC